MSSSSSNAADPASSTSQPSAECKVYKPPRSNPTTPAPDLPDEYFTPTPSDIQLAQSTLAARTQNLVNAPLQLSAAREAVIKSRLDKYPTTTIRIRFSDRTQLEKSFLSTDKIRSVYAFVRNSLRDDVQPIKFVLYSPPKRDLKVSDPAVRDQTLAQLQLAPSSILLVRFLDDSLNGSNVPAPLAQTLLSGAIDLPPPPDFSSSSPSSPPPSKPKSSSSTLGTTNGEKKIPKWLKLGKK